MARIHLLDETLANQIAAGEVIERPAAVVKELVENALDAGAGRIEVELLDGGRKLVRVTDDGHGMSPEDAQLSLQRHATSKLQTKEDLFAIRSYGFRGEALPSMAAVSRFALLTREAAALAGTRIAIDGGRVIEVGEAGAPAGTTVEVRDLFWNVPARRKFQKRAQAEQAQCTDALLRLALPRPSVSFTLSENARVLVTLPAGAPGPMLAQRAEEALGRETRGKLLPFEHAVRGVRAHGLAVSPDADFGSARNVWLFVNGRAIRDRSLTHAVLRAYGDLLPHGRYPGAIVFLEVPPADVDVNVHPAKAEVKLSDARAAWDAIFGALTPVLARGGWLHAGPSPDVNSVHIADGHVNTVPFPQNSVHIPDGHVNSVHQRVAEPSTQYPQLLAPAPYFGGLRYLGQLHRTYLVCEGPEGLVLVDQHAAHERMNYQRLRTAAQGPVQPLLVPQIIPLTAQHAARIADSRALLAGLGFELEPFGETSVAVRALPPQLPPHKLPALLADLAEELAATGRPTGLEARRDALFARAACHASIRAHDALTPPEAQALLDALDQTDYGARCAHGRPVVATFDTAEIERRFGRDYPSYTRLPSPPARTL